MILGELKNTSVDWHLRFFEMAQLVASWSKDPAKKVGAVIVSAETRKIIAMGYNGFPRGITDTKQRLKNQDEKRSLTVHAEANAVIDMLNYSRSGGEHLTMYVTAPPCTECAKLIMQAGISHVISPAIEADSSWANSCLMAKNMFLEALVDLTYLEVTTEEGVAG